VLTLLSSHRCSSPISSSSPPSPSTNIAAHHRPLLSSLIVDSRFLLFGRLADRQPCCSVLLSPSPSPRPSVNSYPWFLPASTYIHLRPLLRCPTPDHYILSLIALHTPAPIPSPCPSPLAASRPQHRSPAPPPNPFPFRCTQQEAKYNWLGY